MSKEVPRARLLRRREVWLPTVWGWLALCFVGGVALIALAFAANGILAMNEPALGRGGTGARILVVEGWLDRADLDQSIEAFRRGRYERVLTTGGPIQAWGESGVWETYAERAASYLQSQGLSDAPIVAIPAPASAQDRTFLSAVVVREWARRAGVTLDAIDLYSAGPHARRSRLLFEMALGDDVEVGILSSTPAQFDAQHWWTTSVGAESILSEALKLAWTQCCFWPPPPGSHEERWAVPSVPE